MFCCTLFCYRPGLSLPLLGRRPSPSGPVRSHVLWIYHAQSRYHRSSFTAPSPHYACFSPPCPAITSCYGVVIYSAALFCNLSLLHCTVPSDVLVLPVVSYTALFFSSIFCTVLLFPALLALFWPSCYQWWWCFYCGTVRVLVYRLRSLCCSALALQCSFLLRSFSWWSGAVAKVI